MALVEIRKLTKIFPQGESAFSARKAEVRAVDDISVDIEAGETLGLVGESGSGKSTLGRLALRLIDPTSGNVRFDGHDLLRASHSELRHLRRHMQIIFQDPFSSLDPRMRVEDLVAEPLLIALDDRKCLIKKRELVVGLLDVARDLPTRRVQRGARCVDLPLGNTLAK